VILRVGTWLLMAAWLGAPAGASGRGAGESRPVDGSAAARSEAATFATARSDAARSDAAFSVARSDGVDARVDAGVRCAGAPEQLSPGTRILRCFRGSGGADELARVRIELGRRMGLAGDAADRLLGALAREDALRARREALPNSASADALQSVDAISIQAVESAFVDAVEAAPDNAAVADEVRRFYAEWGTPGAAPSAGMLDVIGRSADPAMLALRLAGRPGRGNHFQSLALLLGGLAVRPCAAPLWVYAAEAAAAAPSWQIAFLEQAFRCLAPPGSTPAPEQVPAAAAVAESWLSKEMEIGLVPRALAAWRGLPPAVREMVESGATGRFEKEVGGVPFAGELRDMRLDLAALAMLAGNLADARRLLAAAGSGARATATTAVPGPGAAMGGLVPGTLSAAEGVPAAGPGAAAPAASRDWRWAKAARGRELKRQLLQRWLGSSPDDPFGLFVQCLSASGADELDSLDPACWRLALARIAEREGYPEIAAFALTMLKRRGLDVIGGNDEIAGTGRGVPPSVLTGARGVTAEIGRLYREVGEDAQAARTRMRAALGPDPAAPVIDRLLRAAPRVAFAERALPADREPALASRAGGGAAAGARYRSREAPLRLPDGFTAVRSERDGKRAVVIAISDLYDERWSASAGGYWVLLSDEKGSRWRHPLYTGLRANLPYTVRAQSVLPLLAGDRLQVEVEVEELGSFFTSDGGPAELAPRQPRAGIYLEIPLAELERDADGDGLSDLEEERLLTDPEDADTDHDGIGDGEDPMPTIPAVGTSSPAAGAAAALLGHVLAHGQDPPEQRRRPPRGGCCDPAPSAPLGGRPVFVAGERQWFAGLSPAHRLIVLTAEELETWRLKVTAPFFFNIDLLVLDRSGRRACAVWSGANRGGTLALELNGGDWQVEELGSWVS
jgi:hypothetical protein